MVRRVVKWRWRDVRGFQSGVWSVDVWTGVLWLGDEIWSDELRSGGGEMQGGFWSGESRMGVTGVLFLWWYFLFFANRINKIKRVVVKVENTNEKNVVAFQ